VTIFKAGGWQALAQAPSPSPSGSTIQLLNPSKAQSGTLVVNDKKDADTLYHLNAWVQNMPPSPSVEFKIDPATTNLTIPAQALKPPDAFEAFFSLNGISEGTHTLRANLYSNNVFVASDDESIKVNRVSPDPVPPSPPEENAAQTVEINYPSNGGPLGIYTAASGAKNFVFDITTSEVTGQDAPGYLKLTYSVSAPGTEPVWKSCGTAYVDITGTPGGGVTRSLYRCTVTDDVAKVTAVSAVINDTPFPVKLSGPSATYDDSADAHRVLPYAATPTDVTLGLTTQVQQDPNKCAKVVAFVLDQINHPIANVNVDVHAQGPTDQLKFNVAGTFSDASAAPDKGHGPPNQAANCAADGSSFTASGTQGQHEIANQPDIKHVESTNNTSNDGSYIFGLVSDTQGATQYVAWADQDNDDLRCGAEVFENGSIGWKPAGNPAPTGLPTDLTTCPGPSGSPTPTASSPKPTVSPSSPRPTASRSTTPSQATRTVTLVADNSKVTAGKTVQLSGSVLSSTTSCTDNEFIQLRRRIHGETAYADLATTNTDASGAFHFSLIVQKSADYVAVATAHDNCSNQTSDPVTVLAAVKVFIAVEKKAVNRGDTVRFKAAVRPKHDGTKVTLEYKKGRKWVKVKTATLNKRSVGKFRFDADWKGKRTFRISWPSQDDDHEAGQSKTVTVTSK
jgi:hypothetical protein